MAVPLAPPGWWFTNKEGTFTGPPAEPPQEDKANGNDSDGSDNNALDIEPDSPGWEDTEPDVEAVTVQCLLCPSHFPSPVSMLAHCGDLHRFDFPGMVKLMQLDFYATIRYINFVRRNVLNGVADPTSVANPAEMLGGEELMHPVLENDALLYNLDDVIDFDETMEEIVVGAGGNS